MPGEGSSTAHENSAIRTHEIPHPPSLWRLSHWDEANVQDNSKHGGEDLMKDFLVMLKPSASK